MSNAIRKLRAFGGLLGFPHSSAIKGSSLRELRPRAGRSIWRAFYTEVAGELVILSFGPEAGVNRRGFDPACRRAVQRAEALGEEE